MSFGGFGLRYGDDIRLFAGTEKSVQRGLVTLDILSKRLGLIPQITKRRISEVQDIRKLLPSDPSGFDQPEGSVRTTSNQQKRLRKLFVSSFKRNEELNESRETTRNIRVTLFRLRPDKRLLPKVLRLLSAHPEFSDPLNAYLRQFPERTEIKRFLFDLLESAPLYDWHTGRCLETLILMAGYGDLTRLRSISRRFKGQRYHPFLRMAAHLGLVRIKKERKLMLNRSERANSFFLQRETVVSLVGVGDQEEKEHVLRRSLSASRDSVALCAAYIMSSEGLALAPHKEVSAWASAILSSEGRIPKPIRSDRIADILGTRYRIPSRLGFDFRTALGQRYYRRALGHLLEAESSFRTQRSRYVLQMDNFNQILVKVLFKRYPGQAHMRWENVWGAISHQGLNRDFPTFANVASNCHKLRTSSPEPHPYSQTLGAFGREVKVGQRDRLVAQLRAGYREFVTRF